MACNLLSRNLINYSFLLRTLIREQSSVRFSAFQTAQKSITKSNPILILSFIGISFSKKEQEDLKKKMSDLKVQLEKIDVVFEDNKFQDTVDQLKSLDQKNPEVLWRLGRAMYKVSGEVTDTSAKNEMIREAYEKVKESLELDDNNFATHKWYAILLDAKSNLDGLKERVTQLEVVQKHMRKAIELNPQDPTSRYILGEFCYGLADLPWYQRKVVSAIFATPPTATYDEALEHFLKAEELEPDFYHMNKLLIGKSYYQLKNNEKAKEFLEKAANITVQNEDDRKCKEEATSLLKKVK